MRAALFLSATLLAASSAVFAQSAAPAAAGQHPAAPQPTAAQQAELVQRNQKMAGAALQVAQLVDAGKAGEVWDGASPIAKKIVTRDAFIKQIIADRAELGALVSRKALQVTYPVSNGKELPAGIYANVVFYTTFTKGKAPVREMVSFHLENDRVWRVSGYTLH